MATSSIILCLLLTSSAAGEAASAVRLDAAALEREAIPLDSGWRYRPAGEDTEGWRPIAHTAFAPRTSFPDWRGAGSFEIDLLVPPVLVGRPLALRLWHAGASAVSVDGAVIGGFGEVAAAGVAEDPHDPRGRPLSLVFVEPGLHRLTLRYSSLASASAWAGWLTSRQGPGFRAELDLPSRATAELLAPRTAHLFLNLGGAALALGFALLHGLIFLYHPRHRGNLYFALFALLMAVNGVLDSFLHWGAQGLWGTAILRQLNTFVAGGLVIALLLFLGSLEPGPAPRAVRWLAAAFVPISFAYMLPELSGVAIVAYLLWLVAMGVAATVILVRAWRQRAEGVHCLLVSLAGFVVVIGAEVVKKAGALAIAAEVASFGLGVFLILGGASLYLARRIAHEGRELERLAGELEERVAERTAELRRSEREARAASRAKSSFLATMSHEIRTPMNAIVGLAELLAEAPLPERQREMAATLRRSGVSLLRLIDEVLDLSIVESGRLELESKPFRPGELARDVVELFTPQAERDGLSLSWRWASEPLGVLRGDPARVRQVLLNLVGNALKFTEEGGVEVVLGREGDDWTLEVRDTGIGITPEVIPRLFEPFSQVDGSTTRRFGGAGLGLAITHRLVQAMGGTLEAESEPGRGSTFRVRLALTGAEEPPADAEPAADEPHHEPEGDAPLSILLAEDNPVNQMVTQLMLERLGCRAVAVDDGTAALEALARSAFDLVLLDLHMPGMDGIEVARRLRESDGETWIVALTASALPEDRDRCLAAGMDAFLAKPVQLDALRALLRKARKQRHAMTASVIEELEAAEGSGRP